jgi:hypothetical protein
MNFSEDKSMQMENCSTPDLCQECAGRCCMGSPGVWIDPDRFFEIFFAGKHLAIESLQERLPDLGLVLWDVGGVSIPAPGSLVTGCAFQDEEGCRFSVARRPCQCLALVPNAETLAQEKGSRCKMPEGFSRDVAVQRWKEYWQSV